MAELSNAALVLISRMESHPEDFEYGKRFGYLSDSLMGLIGVVQANLHGGHGRLAYLSDADRAALADAWREVNYAKFEKEIMEATFKSDAEFEEEKKQFAYPMGQSTLLAQQSQRVQLQNAMLSSQMPLPQPVSALNNAAAQNNTGLLGSAGSALKGFFG